MIQLGGREQVSIRLIESWPNGLYIGPSDLTHRQLIADHFTDGTNIFDASPVELYFIQRVRNYAHVESLRSAEIRNATVDVHPNWQDCSLHAGRIVNVADASSWLKWFKTLTQAEYGAKVYGRDFGFPPFDLRCICRMSGIIDL